MAASQPDCHFGKSRSSHIHSQIQEPQLKLLSLADFAGRKEGLATAARDLAGDCLYSYQRILEKEQDPELVITLPPAADRAARQPQLPAAPQPAAGDGPAEGKPGREEQPVSGPQAAAAAPQGAVTQHVQRACAEQLLWQSRMQCNASWRPSCLTTAGFLHQGTPHAVKPSSSTSG